MAGDFVSNDYKAFKHLLIYDVVRGEHSTGVAAIAKAGNSDIEVFKEVGAPHYLFDSNNAFDDKGIYRGGAKVMIGHNRAATKGKINAENAHPFQFDDIVGAHNGTLHSVSKLEDGNKFEVDSQAIFYNLSQYKDKDVIANLQGAYALTWWDGEDEQLKIIRNKERPLYWSRRNDGDVIYWASEAWMLQIALERNGIKASDPVAFEVDTLYRFDMDDFNRANMRKRKWRISKDVKGYTYQYQAPVRKDGGTTTSNPFPPSGSATAVGSTSFNHSSKAVPELTTARVNELRALEDTVLSFKFGEVKADQGKTPYISAYPADVNLDYDIRVFCSNHPKNEEWTKDKHGSVYSGKVKRFVQNFVRGKREAYVLIDLRSIEKIESKANTSLEHVKEGTSLFNDSIPFEGTDTPDDGVFYMGYNGAFLTLDEITSCTKHGCAGCTSPIEPRERYVFVDHNEFLCGDCMQQDFYKQFYPEINQQMAVQQLNGV